MRNFSSVASLSQEVKGVGATGVGVGAGVGGVGGVGVGVGAGVGADVGLGVLEQVLQQFSATPSKLHLLSVSFRATH